jgi:hypothetical protein
MGGSFRSARSAKVEERLASCGRAETGYRHRPFRERFWRIDRYLKLRMA